MQRLCVRLLGGFQVTVDGRPVPAEAWRARRGADLVKLLALAAGHRLVRERAMEALWPGLAPAAGLNNLHKAAHLARRAIGDADAVVLRGGQVALAPGAVVESDVERFERADDPDLYGGELLPDDPYEAWTVTARERLRARRLELLRASGRLEELVREEPADEPAQRELMRAALAAGEPQAALRRFERLREALAWAGLHPAAETLALRAGIARGPPVVAPASGGPPLAGRTAELSALTATLRRAAGGRGGTVLLSGEPGVGKTRLAEELLALAARDGWTTLRGAARRDAPRPYGPVAEALDRLLLERPELLPVADRAELARVLPAAPGPAGRADPRSDRGRIFAALARLLTAAAREHGAVLLLDDLHDADAAVLELTSHLAAEAAFAPLVIVVAFGGDPLPAGVRRLATALVERRLAVPLRLGPLDGAAAARLVDAAAATPPAPAVRAAILERAGGNPFFLTELAAASGAEVPGHLYEVLNARLARLGDAARSRLAVMAALGDAFTAGELRAATGADEREALAVLDAALATGVVVEAEGSVYRFRHGLVRKALARPLPAHRRAAAHRDAARGLIAAGAPPARIARHLLAGGREAEAVEWLARAAGAAAAVAAYADALALVELALRHAAPERRGDLLPLRADLLASTGDPEAPAAYAEALAVTHPDGTVQLRTKQARALLAAGDVAAALRAVAAVRARTLADRARLALVRGMLAWFAGDIEAARRGAEEARPLAIEAGLAMEIEQATQLHGAVAHSLGNWVGGARADLALGLRLPRLAGAFFEAHHCVAEYELAAGPPAAIGAAAADLAGAAERAGARRAHAFAATVAGEAALAAGDAAAAARRLGDAAELARAVGATASESLARLRLGEAALATGDERAARRMLAQAGDLARASAIPHHLLYLVSAARVEAAPDPDRAVAELAAGESLLAGAEQCAFCPTAFHVAAAGALAAAGEPERARAHLEPAERASALWHGGLWPAAVAEVRGRLAAAAGEPEQARAHLEAAVDGFAAAGRPRERARAAARLTALI